MFVSKSKRFIFLPSVKHNQRKIKMEKIDLRRYPYRGIVKEIADELGRAVPNVHESLFKVKVPNALLAEMFDRKLQERKKKVDSFRKNLKSAI